MNLSFRLFRVGMLSCGRRSSSSSSHKVFPVIHSMATEKISGRHGCSSVELPEVNQKVVKCGWRRLRCSRCNGQDKRSIVWERRVFLITETSTNTLLFYCIC